MADDGAETFYRGSSPSGSSTSSSREGAPFEPGDFARQLDETFVYAPIATDYRGFTVHQTAPVTQGFLLLSQLNLPRGIRPPELAARRAPDRVHLTIEAKKLAFEDRNRHAGDPAFVKWPLETLIGKEHAARRRAEIDLGRARLPEGALVPEHDGDTSYFAVVDAETAMRSRSSTACRRPSARASWRGDTGITLNNRAGRGFSLDPRAPERHRPRQAHHAHAERVPRVSGRAAVARRRHARRRPADPVEHAGASPASWTTGSRRRRPSRRRAGSASRHRSGEPRAPRGGEARGARARGHPARARRRAGT